MFGWLKKSVRELREGHLLSRRLIKDGRTPALKGNEVSALQE